MKGEIISIICPYCKDVNLFKSRDKFSKWKCSKCIYTFPFNWFNEFSQFEKFVTRKMKLQDKIYTKEELEKVNLKFLQEKDHVIFYGDNIGNIYLFEKFNEGLQYLSIIKNKINVCNGWNN